jgi:O-antigen/teichoic acid export membrane protein
MRKQYGSMLLIKVSSALLLFASQVMPAWCLNIDQFGNFQYLNSILVVLCFVVSWGTDRYCLKEISLVRKDKDSNEADDQVPDATAGKKLFATYAIIVANTLLVAVALPIYLSQKMENGISVALFLICVFILFSRTVAQVTGAITKGLDKVIPSELFTNVLRPLLFVLPLAVCYLTATDISLNAVMFLFGLSFLLVFTGLWIVNLKSAPNLKLQTDMKEIPNLYRMSFFFFLVGVGLPLMSNINTIELGNLRSPDEVALFSAASKLVNLVLLALVSANLLIAPKLSPLFYSGKIADMRKLIRSNNAFVVALTALPVVVILLFAEEILGIFGSKYVAAAPLLRTLVIGKAFSVLCGPVILTATMAGLQKHTAAVVLTCCAVNWLLCISLIPVYGPMGAVYASVIGGILINGALAIIIYVQVGLNVTMSNLLIPAS